MPCTALWEAPSLPFQAATKTALELAVCARLSSQRKDLSHILGIDAVFSDFHLHCVQWVYPMIWKAEINSMKHKKLSLRRMLKITHFVKSVSSQLIYSLWTKCIYGASLSSSCLKRLVLSSLWVLTLLSILAFIDLSFIFFGAFFHLWSKYPLFSIGFTHHFVSAL